MTQDLEWQVEAGARPHTLQLKAATDLLRVENGYDSIPMPPWDHDHMLISSIVPPVLAGLLILCLIPKLYMQDGMAG